MVKTSEIRKHNQHDDPNFLRMYPGEAILEHAPLGEDAKVEKCRKTLRLVHGVEVELAILHAQHHLARVAISLDGVTRRLVESGLRVARIPSCPSL